MNSERSTPASPARRARQKLLEAPLDVQLDLDLLRGWREQRDPSLRSSHLLPALARLTLVAGDPEDITLAPQSWELHGPNIYIGRYHANNGPVDLSLDGLLDHEIYKLGSPHARLMLHERGYWTLKALSPSRRTSLAGEVLLHTQPASPLGHRQHITLGEVTLRFEVLGEQAFTSWRQRVKDVLRVQERPALYLKRQGGICGARMLLTPGSACVLGRSYPREGDFVRPAHWDISDVLDWDLGNLYEHERRHIAFRHAVIRPLNSNDWEIEPLSARHHVTINRLPITDARALQPGDEVGLNSVLFHFHHPRAQEPSTLDTIKLPKLIDWHSELPGKRRGEP